MSKRNLIIGERQDFHLHRRQPQREPTRIVFNEYAGKAFNTTEHSAVDHNRALATFGGHIFQVKAFGQVEVKLDGRQLPQAANSVHHFNINFRPVESGFPGVCGVRNMVFFQHAFERTFGTFPFFYVAGKMFRMFGVARGKFHRVFFKTKRFENVHGIFKSLFDFAFHLFGHAEDVRIILRKSAHP